MVALDALALALVLSGAGETVLLEFSADWCGPCRMVEPSVRRLAAEGYPIRRIDVDRDNRLAAEYRVTGVPCFVMLANGREVDRVVGAASPDRLLKMFAAAGCRPADQAGGPEDLQRAEAKAVPPAVLPNEYASAAGRGARSNAPAGRPETLTQRDPGNGVMASAAQRALQATVRIRVEDRQAQSVGTGTVIDGHQREVLAVTCGHLFRDSAGKGAITVDVFAGGAPASVAGQLISCDLERDVAFVSFIPAAPIQPVQVAAAGQPLARGSEVFSIGCDRGGQPRLLESRITAIDKYLGPPNLEVAGQPVDGRSGGGLFSSQGHLIGVCNAADPADNEGIFASLPAIHWGLDQIGLRSIYQRESPSTMVATRSDRDGQPATHAAPPPPLPPQMPDGPIATRDEAGGESLALADTEVICIVRSRSRTQGNERLFILDQPSEELLRRLARESRPPDRQPGEIALQPIRDARGPAAWPNRSGGGVIRAQSKDP